MKFNRMLMALLAFTGILWLFWGPLYFEPLTFAPGYKEPARLLIEPENCLNDEKSVIVATTIYPGNGGWEERLSCRGGRESVVIHDHSPWADKSESFDYVHVLVYYQQDADILNRSHAINRLARRYDYGEYQLCPDGRMDFGSIKAGAEGQTYLVQCGQQTLEDFYLLDTSPPCCGIPGIRRSP